MKKQNLFRGLLMTALLAGVVMAAGTDNKAYAEGGYLGSGNRTAPAIVAPGPTSGEGDGYAGSAADVAANGSENPTTTANAGESEDFESFVELILGVLF